jgi:hypothetical protein
VQVLGGERGIWPGLEVVDAFARSDEAKAGVVPGEAFEERFERGALQLAGLKNRKNRRKKWNAILPTSEGYAKTRDALVAEVRQRRALRP